MNSAHPDANSSSSEKQPLSLSAVGALIGDPVRAAILLHLTDGSRRPASELAFLAGATPQAASAHLAQLVGGGLLDVQRRGRHRFFRIPSGEIAEMIEALASWADCQPRHVRIDPALCRARLCYDHLAGHLGVAVFDQMAARGWLSLGAEGPDLSPVGADWCRNNGIDAATPARSRRPFIRLCLDWTERRYHLGGHFGAAVARGFLDQGFAVRRGAHRVIEVTPGGTQFLRRELGIDLSHRSDVAKRWSDVDLPPRRAGVRAGSTPHGMSR